MGISLWAKLHKATTARLKFIFFNLAHLTEAKLRRNKNGQEGQRLHSFCHSQAC